MAHIKTGAMATTGLLALLAAAWAVAQPAEEMTFPSEPPQPPQGLLPVIFWPDDNPYSAEKAELGWYLYFDPRLSSDNTVSCATCHDPSKGFTDNLAVSVGISAQEGGRNAPTVINRGFTTLQFWDGRSRSLEDQAKGPLANPIEMTIDDDMEKAHTAVVGRIREVEGYEPLFQAAFGTESGDEITIDHVAKAIATFERMVMSGNSPFDKFKAGDESAMTDSQKRGMEVFFDKAKCDACHLGFNFSDESFSNIGIGYDLETGEFDDIGRFEISGQERDKGAFKTPTLREIEHTFPYMHDGSLQTLEEVVDHYDEGGIKNPQLDQRIKPLVLTDEDKADLVAFMKALSGEGWQHIKAPSEFPQ